MRVLARQSKPKSFASRINRKNKGDIEERLVRLEEAVARLEKAIEGSREQSPVRTLAPSKTFDCHD